MTQTQTQTKAGSFFNSDVLASSIDTIVNEMAKHASAITQVRGPENELKEQYETFLKRAAEARGRGLMLPYLGSGMGNGIFVELADGSVKYDLTNGIGPHFFGHSDPELARVALEAATHDTSMQGHLQMNMDAIEYCELLISEARKGSRLEHCFLSTSGAMANESAMKLCMAYKHAFRVIAFQDCFMGRSLAMSCIGDNPVFRKNLPYVMDVDYMPYFTPHNIRKFGGQTQFIDAAVEKLRRYINRYPDQHACFVFELVQGEGGYNSAPREFFVALMEVCKEHGIPVWLDEIQTFGRTTEMYCYDVFDLGQYVDVLSAGKLTQACATLFTEEFNPTGPLLSGTFLGSTVSLNVGKSMLERLRDGGYYGESGIIAKHHQEFVRLVDALAAKHPDCFPKTDDVPSFAGGLGGMMRMTPFGGKKEKIAEFCKALFEEGAVAIWCGHGPYHARFLPPLGNMSMDEWPRVFEVIERTLLRVAGK
ncbi:MAG: aminotransferase class III-fold pyridoxal phosphate-dependent enzyme [Planctomycetota bacterium]|jgi:4-aminobutyrate aminotransferase-like enzyme